MEDTKSRAPVAVAKTEPRMFGEWADSKKHPAWLLAAARGIARAEGRDLDESVITEHDFDAAIDRAR